MTNDGIAAEIVAMAKLDQAMRRAAALDPKAWDAAIDRANTARLREIVDKVGWPTTSRVGSAAEHAAWLLVQHATHDLAFAKRALALMRQQPPGEVCPKHIAYLEDRIETLEGRPQRFGTQLRRGASGAWETLPLADEAQVDELRASVGLGTLRDYLAGVRR